MFRLPTRALTAAIAAGLMASVVTPPAFARPDQGHVRPAPARQWRNGQHFDARYAPNYQTIDYRRYHRLRPPPRGYRWVRSGNDAVLVAITGGLIASVIANGVN